VSTNKAEIEQIQKYLRGELDAQAMHTLEQQAQDDPFLMDAIEGYEAIGKDQQTNFEDVKKRFAKQYEQTNKRPIPLWRKLAIAATLLIAISAGVLLLRPKIAEQSISKMVLPPDVSKSLSVANTPADDKHVTGIITDATGHTLSGVKLRFKGTELTTQTDSAGRFSLAQTSGGTLNITDAGYESKYISLDGVHQLKIVLTESTNALASVSVTAYVEDDKPANKTHPTIGWKAFRDYLRKNAFTDDGETGLVKLAFTVDTTGTINGIHIVKGKNEALNQKAIALILNGPDWKGITKGETRLKIQFRKAKG
jgi:hypothetical protein